MVCGHLLLHLRVHDWLIVERYSDTRKHLLQGLGACFLPVSHALSISSNCPQEYCNMNEQLKLRNRLKELRAKRKISQTDLGKMVGVGML